MYEYINQLMNKQINLFKHFNSTQFDSIQSESIQFNLNFYFFISIIIHNRSIANFISAANILFDCYRVDLNRTYFFLFFLLVHLLVHFSFYWFMLSFIGSLRHINVSIAFDDNLLAYKIKCLVGSTFSSESN